ncbi:MAG: TetR/AcrR family transcriptional regulator [Actinomycetota bacterium]|nr:TetR/AcrR family transcriptional regulator [Actinomycetota bacterium]
MGRRKQPEIRDRLLDACTDYALAHGLPSRLGPLAAGAGTSPRMLIYHFETRDALLRAILHRARERQVEAFGEVLRTRPDEAYTTTLNRGWQEITGPVGKPYLRMFSQQHDNAWQRLWPEFRQEATTDWLVPLKTGMQSLGRPELATLTLAVIRGLLMDLDATGDSARATGAWADFLSMIENGAAEF